MPHVNLSALTGRELRAQLDSCRARGDAAAAYGILQEMAARRQAGRSKGAKRAGDPRVVEVDLGDPLEEAEEIPPAPHWRAPEYVRTEAQPTAEVAVAVVAPEPEAEPLVLSIPEPPTPAAEPLPPLELPARTTRAKATKRAERPARPERPAKPASPLGGWKVAAGFAVGITAGLALGWAAANRLVPPAPVAEPLPSLVAEVAPPPTVEVAQAAPAEAAAPAIEPTAEEIPAPVVETAEIGEAAEAMATPVEAAPDAVKVEAAERSAAPDCAAQPTPADREICRDARLQKLQRELRRAYSDALAAHEDRATLRQRQLAWRDARNDVADPSRLARLYEQRIEKLDAAASAARAQH